MTPLHIIIHISDSPGGTIEEIDEWHKARAFRRSDVGPRDLRHVGYHYVITNGHDSPGGLDSYDPASDGAVWPGRREDEPGAHARGLNDSIGVCLIGRGAVTDNQIIAAHALVVALRYRWGIGIGRVIGHCETPFERSSPSPKTCPGPAVDMAQFRRAQERVTIPLQSLGG